MAVIVKKLENSDVDNYGIPYNHIYILNDGNTGWVKINGVIKLDIEKIDKIEDLKIKKLEWSISGSGSTFAILSHEKLSTDYIMRLMLSRIYTELQKKSSKKKIVYVDASSSTTVTAGSSETITIQPPEGKIWKPIHLYFRVNAPPSATTGNHQTGVSLGSSLSLSNIPYVRADYNSELQIRTYPITYSALYPNDIKAHGDYIRGLKASYDYPLRIIYSNSTDVDQTYTRGIKLILEEEDEAE